MKNYLIKTNADTQIWITKGTQMVVFTEWDCLKLNMLPSKELLPVIGNFDEIVSLNVDISIHPLDFSGVEILAEEEL